MTYLKCEKKTVIHVDYRDLEKFLTEVYGQKFEFVVDQEATNYTSYEFNISKEQLDAWDTDQLTKFQRGSQPGFVAQILLTDCCNKNLIEPGLYIVKVFW